MSASRAPRDMAETQEGQPRRALVMVPAVLSCLTLLSAAASAGDWTLTDGLTARATAVDRSGSSAESGLVFQLSPRIRLNGRGARASADVNYQLTASAGTSSTNPERFSHNLLAKGQLEAIEDFFFLGGSASARLIGDTASSGSVDAINVNSEGRQSYSLKITPEFRHRLNRYADIVSRNAIDYVTYSGDNAANNDDSTSTTLNLGVRSGAYFLPFDWTLDATQRKTEYDAYDETRSTSYAGLGYRVNSRWRVNGRLGYERNDVETVRDKTDGTIWAVGADWTPNPRTSVSAEFGERYFGNIYSAKVRHETRRTLFSMDLSRDISNRRTQQLVDSFFILTDGSGNIIVDPNTGNPIIVNVPFERQINEDYVNTQLRAAVRVTGLRTSATVTGTVSNREYELSSTEQDTYGLSLTVSRQLGGDYNGTFGSSYTHSEGSAENDSDTYDLRLSLGKRLSTRTRASIDFLHRDRDAAGGADYTENRIGVSLSTSFL